MKQFYAILLTLLIVLSACNQSSIKEVDRITIPLEIVSSGLMSSMPGTLLVYDKELVWIDATADQNIHIVDRENGVEKKILALRGNGPKEIVTPEIAWAPDRQLLVFDRNGAKQLFVSLDSLDDNEWGIRRIVNLEQRFSGLRNILLADSRTVFELLDSEKPFLLLSDSSELLFGSYPLKETDIDNRFEICQGVEAYNPYNGKLLHSIGQLSYMALYQWHNTQFVLEKDTLLSKVDYTFSANQFTINKTPRYAPTAIAITKDYIVAIDRDKKSISTINTSSESSNVRPFQKAPHHVFVYDNDLRLVKIVDVGVPVFRIASDYTSNRIFLIGANPEFCIGTIELPL